MAQGEKPTGIGAYAQKAILAQVKVKRLEAQLKAAKDAFNTARAQAQDVLVAQGLKSIVYRGFTLYLHEDDHASLVSDEEGEKTAAHEALKKAGLEWMIKPTVHPKTLTSWVREQPIDEKTMERKLPEDLKEHISIFHKAEIRIKKKP